MVIPPGTGRQISLCLGLQPLFGVTQRLAHILMIDQAAVRDSDACYYKESRDMKSLIYVIIFFCSVGGQSQTTADKGKSDLNDGKFSYSDFFDYELSIDWLESPVSENGRARTWVEFHLCNAENAPEVANPSTYRDLLDRNCTLIKKSEPYVGIDLSHRLGQIHTFSNEDVAKTYRWITGSSVPTSSPEDAAKFCSREMGRSNVSESDYFKAGPKFEKVHSEISLVDFYMRAKRLKIPVDKAVLNISVWYQSFPFDIKNSSYGVVFGKAGNYETTWHCVLNPIWGSPDLVGQERKDVVMLYVHDNAAGNSLTLKSNKGGSRFALSLKSKYPRKEFADYLPPYRTFSMTNASRLTGKRSIEITLFDLIQLANLYWERWTLPYWKLLAIDGFPSAEQEAEIATVVKSLKREQKDEIEVFFENYLTAMLDTRDTAEKLLRQEEAALDQRSHGGGGSSISIYNSGGGGHSNLQRYEYYWNGLGNMADHMRDVFNQTIK